MRIDLHTHTWHSRGFFGLDGISSPKEIVRAARANGLGGIAITDHDSVSGLKEAINYGRKIGVMVVPGIEVRTATGDVLALGIKDLVEKNLALDETIERIHELGGLAVAAHPFGYWPRKGIGMKIKGYKFDAVEGFNAGIFNNNKKAIALAKEFNLPLTAGSDAHCAQHVGLAYTRCNATTVDDVLASIRGGKTSIYGKKMRVAAWLSLTVRKLMR